MDPSVLMMMMLAPTLHRRKQGAAFVTVRCRQAWKDLPDAQTMLLLVVMPAQMMQTKAAAELSCVLAGQAASRDRQNRVVDKTSCAASKECSTHVLLAAAPSVGLHRAELTAYPSIWHQRLMQLRDCRVCTRVMPI